MGEVNTSPIDNYLSELWQRDGTDLLLTAGAPPMLRIDGRIERIDSHPLRPEDMNRIVRGVLAGELWDQFGGDREIDFSFNWEDKARFRGNAFHQRGSTARSS